MRARLRVSSDGSIKPSELTQLLGIGDADIARLGLVGLKDGVEYDPLDPPLLPRPAPRTSTEPHFKSTVEPTRRIVHALDVYPPTFES